MFYFKCFINDCPFPAVTLIGKMDEGLLPGRKIVLVNKEAGQYCQKFIERVVDAGDGSCILDLY